MINVKALRDELGMTQQAFADAVGVSRNNVAQWEAGRGKPP